MRFRFVLMLLLAGSLLLPAAANAIDLSADPWAEDDPDMAQMDLLELLFAYGVIDEETYLELQKLYAKRVYNGVRPTGSILLDFTPWNQTPYDEVITYPGAPTDERGFRLRKAALGLAGSVYYNWLSFKVTAEARNSDDGRTDVGLEQAYIKAAYVPYRLRGSMFVPKHGFTLGAMKLPFSRQNLTSTNELQLIHRAMVVDEMPISYDLGATFDASYSYSYDLIKLSLRGGAFNGRGDKVYSADNNDNLLYAGRARLDLLNPMRRGEGDLQPQFWPNKLLAKFPEATGPQLSFGFSYLQNNDIDRIVTAWGADAEIRWFGVSLLGEIIHTRFEPDLTDTTLPDQYAEDWETDGWYVQGGYFIRWIDVELAARYEQYNLDLLSDNMDRRRLANTTYGLTWHAAGRHRAKLMANYIMRAELEGMPEVDNDTVTLQAGLAF